MREMFRQHASTRFGNHLLLIRAFAWLKVASSSPQEQQPIRHKASSRDLSSLASEAPSHICRLTGGSAALGSVAASRGEEGGEPSALRASFLWLSSHSATSNHTDAVLNFLILHNQEWGFFHLTDDCTAAALLLFLLPLFAFPICILIQLWKPPYGSQSGCSSPSLPVNVIVSLTATSFHKKAL